MKLKKIKTNRLVNKLLILTAFLLFGGSNLQAGNNSKFISVVAPSQVYTGQTFNVQVTFKNIGTTTWTKTQPNPFRLGSQNPQDNMTWGLLRVELPVNQVAPQQSVTFSFTATAPSTPKNYNFQWRMVQELVQWFGEYSINKVIKVVNPANDSKYISQSVPSTLNPGQNFNASFTFKNNGGTIWKVNGDKSWWLGSENPRDNFTWNTNRAGRVNTTVNPGQSYTFNASLKAPSQAGEYEMQWMMLQNYVEWFGDKTPNLYIKVGNIIDDAQFISQQVPSAVYTNQNFTATLVYKNTGNSIWKKGTYCLASEAPPNNTVWGVSRIEIPHNVVKNETVSITATFKAPAQPGSYAFQWRPSKGGSTRFGQMSTAKSIYVQGFYDSWYLGGSVPYTVESGSQFYIYPRFQNTGNMPWNNVQLNVSPGLSFMGSTIASAPPGGTVQFSLYVTAPVNNGPGNDYVNFNMRLIGPQGDFGDIAYESFTVEPKQSKNSLSINDEGGNDSNISIMPNPVSDVLKVEFTDQNDEYAVMLLDLTGKVLYKNISNSKTLEINVSDFEKGIYFLTVECKNQTYQNKIVIN